MKLLGKETVPLTMAHRTLLEARWKPMREKYALPYAEYSFANVYLFRRTHDYELWENEYPLVAGKRGPDSHYLIPSFSLEETPPLLELLVKEPNISLFPIPDQWKEQRPHCRFDMSIDDSDYVFKAEKLRTLAGRKLSSRRNLIHQLEREYEMHSEKLTETNVKDAFQILEQWQSANPMPKEQTDFFPMQEALELLKPLGLCGCISYANGQPAGLTIGELINPQTAILLFAKGLRTFKGIVPYLYRHFAEHLPAEVEWVNLEQDLGNPSLRQAKEAYEPDLIVNKWYYRC